MSGFVDAVVQRRTSSTDAAEQDANPDSEQDANSDFEQDDEEHGSETNLDGAAAEQLHAKDQELSKLSSQVTKLEAKLRSDAKEIATLKKDLSGAQKQVRECHDSTKLLASDGENAAAMLSVQVTELAKQLKAEQESCVAKAGEISHLELEKQLSSERLTTLKKEQEQVLQEKNKEIEQKEMLIQTVKEASNRALEAETQKYEDLKGQLTNASEKILRLTGSVESKDVRIAELTRELHTEKETLGTNITELERPKAAQETAVTEQKTTLAALEEALTQSRDAKNNIQLRNDNLQLKLDDQKEAMTALETELAASKSDAATSKAERCCDVSCFCSCRRNGRRCSATLTMLRCPPSSHCCCRRRQCRCRQERGCLRQ